MENIETKTDDVSVLPASQFNNNLRNELQNAVTNSGQTLSAANLNQLGQAMAKYGAGGGYFYTDNGVVNSYSLVAIDNFKSPNAYFDGMEAVCIAGNTNTGPSTINVVGIGSKNLKDINGTALSGGEIESGEIFSCRFNLSADEFRLQDRILEVDQSQLKSTTTQLATASTLALLTSGAGTYGFWPTVKSSTAGNIQYFMAPLDFLSANNATQTSFVLATVDLNRFTMGAESGQTLTMTQRFVQASPPYDIGDGICHSFIFALIDNSTGKIGLVGYWDVVAFDEFAGKQKKVDKALVDILKNYMANKSFSRGIETLGADASTVFIGNTRHTLP